MKIDTKIKILVKRKGALGDVILTTGVVRELYKKYNGHAIIDVCTDYPEVFDNNPYVSEVYHTNKLPSVKWDIVFDLNNSYEMNPKNHFIDSYFYYVFGDNNLNKQTDIFCNENDCKIVDEDLRNIGGNFITIHIRNWWTEHKNIKHEVWLEVADRFLKRFPDYKIVTVGGPKDFSVNHPSFFSVTGKYNASQLKYLFNHSKCFVGIDSGPFHIAGSSNVPIVALLSHVSPSMVLPYRNNIMGYNCRPVQADLPCVGCMAKQEVPGTGIKCVSNFDCSWKWDIDNIVEQISLSIAG